MNLWDEFGDSASIWTYQLGNLNSWYCLFCLIPQVMTSLWSHYWLQAITVVSLVFFFSEITCMCWDRSGDKATTPERNHKTNNKQCTGVSSDTGSRLEHDQRRGRDEWTECLAANRAMRDWCVSPAAGGFVLFNPWALCVCMCVLSHTGSCFIQYQGINIHSVEHDWQSVYFREGKWQTVYFSLSLDFFYFQSLLYLT